MSGNSDASGTSCVMWGQVESCGQLGFRISPVKWANRAISEVKINEEKKCQFLPHLVGSSCSENVSSPGCGAQVLQPENHLATPLAV